MARIIFDGHEGCEPTVEEVLKLRNYAVTTGLKLVTVAAYDTAIYGEYSDGHMIKLDRKKNEG